MRAAFTFPEVHSLFRTLDTVVATVNARVSAYKAVKAIQATEASQKQAMIKDAWKKGSCDAVFDKKQNPYPRGTERFKSYEAGYQSHGWSAN